MSGEREASFDVFLFVLFSLKFETLFVVLYNISCSIDFVACLKGRKGVCSGFVRRGFWLMSFEAALYA